MPDSISFDGRNVWKVPAELNSKYHGCGYAMVAIKNDKLVAIQYLADLDDSFYFDDEILEELGISQEQRLEQIASDLKTGQAAKFLNTLGNVHVGMMSCHEFVEL